MKIFGRYFISILIIVLFVSPANAKKTPYSFADLAEKLMPSVVNISTTQTIVTNVNVAIIM